MPIVEPMSLKALNLIDFQINPHYVDAEEDRKHMYETREERLMQYLEENLTTVVGLREGAMLRLESDVLTLKGTAGARLFRHGQGPEEVTVGADLSGLL
jgi:dipeptidase E